MLIFDFEKKSHVLINNLRKYFKDVDKFNL